MSPVRFVYFNAGEIVTASLLGLFLFFIFFSFTESHSILDNEESSKNAINEIYRLQTEHFEKNGRFASLEEMIAGSDLLGRFKTYPKQMKDYDSQELASDGDYFYLLKLEREDSDTGLFPDNETIPPATGFECICWPRHFGSTGETCYYVNSSGKFSVSSNTFGEMDGIKKHTTFPPDTKLAARAVPKSRANKGELWHQLPGRSAALSLPDPFE